MNLSEDIESTSIAITGMAGRFPGAASVDQFWANLCGGVESVKTLTEQELRAAGVPEQMLKNPALIRAKAVLENIEYFDAQFFGMPAREAELTNPQHRLFLECAVEALADAGCDPELCGGDIGVYAGAGSNGYVGKCHAAGLVVALGKFRTLTANDKDYLASFASYKLDLKGPSVTVQTACSTSLVAVHMACQALIGGECSIALAGGASVDVDPGAAHLYQEGGILAPDGHCRAFDARAQGTVGGSGVAVVVLRNLTDALRDGDHIYAVIRGSAMNNDGRLKLGYTAPSVEGQARVIADAQRVAGVSPESITYVEAHGTATALGDPIEVEALSRAGFRGDGPPCALGSVKTNVGHLDVAAGAAGLIKAALAVEHGLLPASLHYEIPNPRIDFSSTRLFVNAALSRWDTNGKPRRAGVSSFGIGGTNSHVILEQAPPAPPAEPGRASQLICLSAQTESALKASASDFARYLRTNPGVALADVAFTLHVGRPQYPYRLAIVARTCQEAAMALEEGSVPVYHEAGHRPVVFMFPGQGSHYVEGARELYKSEPAVREEIDACLAIAGVSYPELRAVLFAPAENSGAPSHDLMQTEYAQVGLFIYEYALARTLMRWGIAPGAMIGHSVGEYVAACVSECLSLEDALRLITRRARLMQRMPGGRMLAIEVPEAGAKAMLREKLSLAAVNGPAECVVSGDAAEIENLQVRMERSQIRFHLLHTSHAFHSSMMDAVLDEFARELRQVTLNAPRVPFISNVSGTWITPEEAQDPDYWVRHIRNTVRFGDGIRELGKERDRLYVEVGPGRVLSALAAKTLQDAGPSPVISVSAGRSGRRSETEAFLAAIGDIWARGHRLPWPRFYEHQRRSRLRLPTYPFERQYYWANPKPQHAALTQPSNGSRGAAAPTQVEELIDMQLQLMSEQLKLLSIAPGEAQTG